MKFQPIAIIGQSCVLPGALNPEELWQAVHQKKNLITEAESGSWGGENSDFMAKSAKNRVIPLDKSWHSFGGHVRGFEQVFDPGAYDLDRSLIDKLDPLFHWVLHAGKSAYGEPKSNQRGGAVIGNLSYPTTSFNKVAQKIWCDSLEIESNNPLNRFMSGYPAALLAKALNLSAPAYCLDAACASSLYAIKLACDELHYGNADVMLAGGVNAIDDLFLHVGFSSLNALSKSGKSRPFHNDADGLIPAVGAAFVSLKRLSDAEADGDEILAVIKGIGLSNDGKDGGLLSPSSEGQVKAMSIAYQSSDISPDTISLIECHATGTSVGDSVELESLSKIYQGSSEIPIGSLKSNLGHLVTAAGVAGVLKVIAAMKAGVRPATIGIDTPLPQIKNSPFRILTEAEPWNVQSPKKAAVSAFGFGGNNAHIILEEYQKQSTKSHFDSKELSDLAIIGIGLRVADLENTDAVAKAWLYSDSQIKTNHQGIQEAKTEAIKIDVLSSGIPPNDLKQIHPQQLAAMAATNEAIESAGDLDNEHTGVFIGMATDVDAARYFSRLQVPYLIEESDLPWQLAAKDAITPGLNGIRTLGCMPNVVANRINIQHNFKGQSLTFSAEELSGIEALHGARYALLNHEIDTAIVGAVDLCCEAVQTSVAKMCLPENSQIPGDAAVSLVIKRLADAQKSGDRIYAVIGDDCKSADLTVNNEDISNVFGHAHAASGLLQVAMGAIAVYHNAKPGKQAPIPNGVSKEEFNVRANVKSFTGQKKVVCLRAADQSRDDKNNVGSLFKSLAPKLYIYAGADKREIITNLKNNHQSSQGRARLAIIAKSAAEYEQKKRLTLQLLTSDRHQKGYTLMPGIYFAHQPLKGELAFTFPSSAGTYFGMGRDLLLAYPEVLKKFQQRINNVSHLKEAAEWIYADNVEENDVSLFNKLKGGLFLSLAHSIFSQEVLGLKPEVFIGFSAGETAALFSSGVWQDLAQYHQQIADYGIWTHELAGKFNLLDRAWRNQPNVEKRWATWGIQAPYDVLDKALSDEPLVHLATINCKNTFSICGQADACARVVEKIGKNKCLSLPYNLIHHCPEFEHYKDTWVTLNTRKAHQVNVRFYGAENPQVPFYPEKQAIAKALLGVGKETINYPKIIESAYDSGVRIFVEHGARSSCSSYIKQILGEREHLAVSLDGSGKNSVQKIFETCAELYVAGVEVNLAGLNRDKNWHTALTSDKPKNLSLRKIPAHAPDIVLPIFDSEVSQPPKIEKNPQALPVQIMPKAPVLPEGLPSGFDIPISIIKTSTAQDKFEQEMATQASASKEANTSLKTGSKSYLAQVAELHRDFIKQQAEVQERFLKVNQNIMFAAASPAMNGVSSGLTPALHPPVIPSLPIKTGTKDAQHKIKVLNADLIQKASPVRSKPKGPSFDREQLKIHASGNISEIFGELFTQQDRYDLQVRMPSEPMLLTDRVIGIDAELGSLKLGTVWTETDIKHDSWYLYQGHIPPGIMIEAGQADLFLISYLGIDFKNKGKRAYRLLGCQVTFLDELPRAGDTLEYEIHIDSHAIDGDIHLFFFHYDCYVDGKHILKVRNGQAGFFTKQELLKSKGVIWTPHDTKLKPNNFTLDAPLAECSKTAFSRSQLKAFAAGDLPQCFGNTFAYANTHTRTPTVSPGKRLLIDEVTDFIKMGGPWGRGYLRAVRKISPEDWFFKGHFKNDPCMPGTLMTDMAFQGMAIYLAALGYTLNKDGWTFAPVTNQAVNLFCRSQVTPTSKELVLEIYIREIIAGDEPTIYADILSTVDGLKALHGENISLRLIPNYPNPLRKSISEVEKSTLSKNVAVVDGIPCDEKQSSDCSLGKPSEAFGSKFQKFDNGRRLSRLPGDPYNFISRILEIEGRYCGMQTGSELISEWDVPDNCIFYGENGYPTLPFCVILEAVLQPCGWLGCYVGCPLEYDVELFFRNLDGTLNLYRDCLPKGSTIRTHVKNTNISKSAGIIIISFTVEAFIAYEKLLDLTTVFGYFPANALEQQVGLSTEYAEKIELAKDSDFSLELLSRPEPFFTGDLKLAGQKLLMLDRISGYWTKGGKKSLGKVRGEKAVDSDEWFFKAHFFQDPVQPGSLGIEPMLQLLQFYMLENNMDRGFSNPRFEPLAFDIPVTWRYRGQISPKNKIIQTIMDIVEVGKDDKSTYVIGEGSLWCDGLKIYDAQNIGMRIIENTNENQEQILPIDRAKLEAHSNGNFTALPVINSNIKLPAPPFLLLDRVMEMQTVSIDNQNAYISVDWDLKKGEWYLDHGDRLSGALLFEAAGQASIFLCSLIDNDISQDKRVYRVLALKEIQFYGSLPKAGDTLSYKVTLKQKITQGKNTFLIFEYQCYSRGRLLAEVGSAMAALLPKSELLNAKGVSWSAANITPNPNSIFDKPLVAIESITFGKDKIIAFSQAQGESCFGNKFKILNTHHQTPHLPAGMSLQIDEIKEFDPDGSPWGRGYLRAVKHINPHAWFFTAHFKDDPCMPAALVASGCFQCLSFYLAACGFTLEKDKHYFAPITDQIFEYQGGGEITPKNNIITYEVFVEEIAGGNIPFIKAYVLVSVDEQKSVMITKLGVKLDKTFRYE
jgi:acyl transferase domain-containing protein/3-hydroxymyristoyl/3-hydroxydecanoyl-(acyl carrier protein) dehydratase